MSNELWDEVFRLVNEYDAKRPIFVKEYRLYYNDDGTIIGLWETGHPDGDNYIILDDPGMFFHNNTLYLRVKDKKLILLDHKEPSRVRLQKSKTGFKTAKGYASIILEDDDTYSQIEFYEQTNN